MKCRRCGGEIRFANNRPVELDGGDHWDICEARFMRLVRAEGKPFKTPEGDEGYVYRGERMWTHRVGKWIKGSEYVAACGRCSVPPWEECECSPWEPKLEPDEREHLSAILNEEPENKSGATG